MQTAFSISATGSDYTVTHRELMFMSKLSRCLCEWGIKKNGFKLFG